jgi:hypothetical protein
MPDDKKTKLPEPASAPVAAPPSAIELAIDAWWSGCQSDLAALRETATHNAMQPRLAALKKQLK